jgi:predicted transcriptional regulator of viral defense system
MKDCYGEGEKLRSEIMAQVEQDRIKHKETILSVIKSKNKIWTLSEVNDQVPGFSRKKVRLIILELMKEGLLDGVKMSGDLQARQWFVKGANK